MAQSSKISVTYENQKAIVPATTIISKKHNSNISIGGLNMIDYKVTSAREGYRYLIISKQVHEGYIFKRSSDSSRISFKQVGASQYIALVQSDVQVYKKPHYHVLGKAIRLQRNYVNYINTNAHNHHIVFDDTIVGDNMLEFIGTI